MIFNNFFIMRGKPQMTLVSKVAKDYEKIINKGVFDPMDVKTKLDFFLERNRVSAAEHEYLLTKMEAKLDEQLQLAVSKL